MKTKIKRDWRLRERVLGWQRQRLGVPACAAEPQPQRPTEALTLAQRLEQQNPKGTPRAAPELTWPPGQNSQALSPQLLFRAGQIWRRSDRQAELFVDFSDGEQVEIRWLGGEEWGPPHVMQINDLLTYVRAKDLRVDWPGTTR